MNLIEFLKLNWQDVLVLTREHIFLVLISTGMAVLIGLPLGIVLTKVRALRSPVLGFANVMQTVPSLALFGLLIPVPFIGGIGARTAIIALALYALLPVIRNTAVGILGIDKSLGESAKAVGMTNWQQLRLVELPLAMPTILTGIRVAVVISVGVATVAAAVGAGGLGTYIFRGLRQNDNNLLVAGALASAALALLCDLAIGQMEKIMSARRRKSLALPKWILAGVTALMTIVVLLSYIPAAGVRTEISSTEKPIVIGSKDFTESVILAEILAQLLEKEGTPVQRQFELGGNLVHDGLLSQQIDVYPEYTGTAFTAILKHPPLTDPTAVYSAVKAEYGEKFGLEISQPLGFANDFAILIRGEVARKANYKNISDVVKDSRMWQAGFGQDFMSRADGYPGFEKAYGFQFARQPREMDLSLTYQALKAGELDIIAGNSTDGMISVLDLFQLEDDKRYFPPYEAVFVFRRQVSPHLGTALSKLANAISKTDMRRLNHEVDGNKRTPQAVAAEWLSAIDK